MITSASLLEALDTAREKGYNLDSPVVFWHSANDGTITCRSTINAVEIHPDGVSLWQSDANTHDAIYLLGE